KQNTLTNFTNSASSQEINEVKKVNQIFADFCRNEIGGQDINEIRTKLNVNEKERLITRITQEKKELETKYKKKAKQLDEEQCENNQLTEKNTNLEKKITELQTESKQDQQEYHDQLRQINLLFDAKAQDYQQLQQELLAKVKPGVKASDLKKLKRSKSANDIANNNPPTPLLQDQLLTETKEQLDNSLFARVEAVKQFGLIYDKLQQIKQELNATEEQASEEL
ncbi:19646_t:CDS:2, partial [Funneliformis geosporum]